VLDALEAYLDHLDGSDGTGEGLPAMAAEHLAAVSAHLEICPACARELALAGRIRAGLRALPVAERGGTEGSTESSTEARRAAPWAAWAGVAVVAAAALGIAVAALVRTPAPAPQYSAAAVARAETQARYAFARVAEISRRTGRELRDDVLTRRVAAPTAAAVVHSLDLSRLRPEPLSPPTGDSPTGNPPTGDPR
jgi:hypothetical protein